MIEDWFTLQEFIERFSTEGVLSFEQKEWIDEYERSRINLSGYMNTGRSTIGNGIILWKSLSECSSTSMIITDSKEKVNLMKNDFIRQIRLVENYLQSEDLITRSSMDLQLLNGSRIFFRTLDVNYLRGMGLNSIFLDLNLSSLDDLSEDLLLVMLPCLTKNNGKLILSLDKQNEIK